MFDVSTAYRAEMHDHTRGYLFTTINLHLTDGRVLTYENDKIVSTNRTNYVSEISAELPRKQFTFTVDNNSHQYSVDNPNGYAPYIEEGCLCEWVYRQQIKSTGEYEEVGGGRTILQTWNSDDYYTTFTTVGQMDYMSGEYYKGDFYEDGRSLYDLAVDVLKDAGVSSYIIDDALKNIKTQNPLPVDTHVNCLQLIANAGRAILYEDRNGNIVIEQNQPTESGGKDITASSMATFADLSSVHQGSSIGYASGETNYTTLTGNRFFAPEGLTNLPVGYVSTSIADSNGNISGSPSITINYRSATNVNLVTVDTNGSYTCVGYRNNAQVSSSTDGTVGQTVDSVVITFTSAEPGQRVHVGRLYVDGGASDYQLTYRELIAPPNVTNTERVANVSVEYKTYTKPEKQLRIIFDKTEITKVIASCEGSNTCDILDHINCNDLAYTFDPPDIVGKTYKGYKIERIAIKGFNIRPINEPIDGKRGWFDFIVPNDPNRQGEAVYDSKFMWTSAATGIIARGDCDWTNGYQGLGVRCRTKGTFLLEFTVEVTHSNGQFIINGYEPNGFMNGFIAGLDQFVTLNVVPKDDNHDYNDLVSYTENGEFFNPRTENALATINATVGSNIVKLPNPAYGFSVGGNDARFTRPLIVPEHTSVKIRTGQTMTIKYVVSPMTNYNYRNANGIIVFDGTSELPVATALIDGTDAKPTRALSVRAVTHNSVTVVGGFLEMDSSYTYIPETHNLILALTTGGVGGKQHIISMSRVSITVDSTGWSNAYPSKTDNFEYNNEYANALKNAISSAKIVNSGAYYAEIVSGNNVSVSLFGTEYVVNDDVYTRALNPSGVEKTASNPLIGSRQMAIDLAKWLEDYYSADVEYSLTYRGEPTVDCSDSILLENLFVDENIVKINNESLDTAAGYAHSATVVARRIKKKEGGFPYTGVELDHGRVGSPVGVRLKNPTDFDLSFQKTDYITVELPENADYVGFTFWVVTGTNEPMGAVTPTPGGSYDRESTVVWMTNTIYQPKNTYDRRAGGYATPWPKGQYMWGVHCWAFNPGIQDVVIQQGGETLNLTIEVVQSSAWPESGGGWIETW